MAIFVKNKNDIHRLVKLKKSYECNLFVFVCVYYRTSKIKLTKITEI